MSILISSENEKLTKELIEKVCKEIIDKELYKERFLDVNFKCKEIYEKRVIMLIDKAFTELRKEVYKKGYLITLGEPETVDDIYRCGYKVIQYCFNNIKIKE